jgi:SAM-dependent methyltransferase
MSEHSKQVYLGTNLTPDAYYKQRSESYANPHEDGIAQLFPELVESIHTDDFKTIIDIGCGPGLATSLSKRYWPEAVYIGLDKYAPMITRYTLEQQSTGLCQDFAAPIPQGDLAVSIHALHLATPIELIQFWANLHQAEIKYLLVITPLKDRPATPEYYFERKISLARPYGPDQKTLYGYVFRRQ